MGILHGAAMMHCAAALIFLRMVLKMRAAILTFCRTVKMRSRTGALPDCKRQPPTHTGESLSRMGGPIYFRVDISAVRGCNLPVR